MSKILAIESSCDETAAAIIDNGNLLLTLVGFHAVIPHLIDDMSSVGRCRIATDAPHSPKSLRCHAAVIQFDGLFSDSHVFFCF